MAIIEENPNNPQIEGEIDNEEETKVKKIKSKKKPADIAHE